MTTTPGARPARPRKPQLNLTVRSRELLSPSMVTALTVMAVAATVPAAVGGPTSLRLRSPHCIECRL